MSKDYEIDEVLIDGGLVNVAEFNNIRKVNEEEQEEAPVPKRGWFGGKKKKNEKSAAPDVKKAAAPDAEKDAVKDILEDLQLDMEDDDKENLKLDVELDIEEKDIKNDVEKVVRMQAEQDMEKDVEGNLEKDVEKDAEKDNFSNPSDEKSAVEVEVEETESSVIAKAFSNFGEKLLNVCTFGIFSNTITATDDPGTTTEKLTRVSTASIPGSRTIDPEMGDSTRNTYADNDRALLMCNSSIHSGGSSTARYMTIFATKQNREKICCYVMGIVIFLVMAVLFAFGGIFLKRNGW